MIETEVKIKVQYKVWHYSSEGKEQSETIEIGKHDMFIFDHDYTHYPIFSKAPRLEWISTQFSLVDNDTIINTISVSHPFQIEKIERKDIDPKNNHEGIMYKIRAKEEIEG